MRLRVTHIILARSGQRDFAAAVLLPHATAAAAALQRQSAAVAPAAHVELLYTPVIGVLKYVRGVYYIQYIAPHVPCIEQHIF
jgi:hypothetical protein